MSWLSQATGINIDLHKPNTITTAAQTIISEYEPQLIKRTEDAINNFLVQKGLAVDAAEADALITEALRSANLLLTGKTG